MTKNIFEPDDLNKLCKGDYLASVMEDLDGQDESSIALALGYFHIDDQGKKIPLVDHLKKAIDEAEKNHSATHKDEDNFFDIYKDRLVISDDHTGIVYVPKRLVEANKDFYEGTELVNFDIDYVNEEITYGDSDSAEEYIEELGFKEPMMVQSVMNMVYVNPWDLKWIEGSSWFTYEEIADYWGLRYEDCCKESSTWRDD